MNTRTTPPKRSTGYTLVEMTAALAVASALLGAAVPPMGELLASARLSTRSSELLFDFYLARSEAIKRNARVAVCASTDGVACAPGGEWEQGLIVFHDANANGLLDASEEVIRQSGPTPGSLSVRGNQNVARYVSYAPDGRAKLASGAFQAGTITLCVRSGKPTEGRQLIINTGGRPRMQRVQVETCV